ncbi:MAG: aldo/keto reductase [Boseongicola sp. SB0673_bin_14]|nr:aldo/keto reductase [Boseongicola sp. SB0673_bin_14]
MPGLRTVSGQALSRFSFGTMQFGGAADETASAEMYSACREAGINFFDTAFLYAEGRSEEIVGRLVASERDDVFIATKFGYHGAGRSRVEEEFGASRKRLGMESVDLLYLHRWDGETPLEETFETLAGYREDGSVRALGVSNFAAWQVMKAREVARELGVEIRFLQPMYNLVKRQVEVEMLPMAIAEGLAVCPYSPLGGGLLTGKYASGETGRLAASKNYAVRYGFDWMHEAVANLVKIAEEVGAAPATLAVAWAAWHPGVWGPIISGKSMEQLAPSLAAIDFEIDDALHARLSALSPAPPPATDRSEEA